MKNEKLTIGDIIKIADELEIDYDFEEGCDTINGEPIKLENALGKRYKNK